MNLRNKLSKRQLDAKDCILYGSIFVKFDDIANDAMIAVRLSQVVEVPLVLIRVFVEREDM